MLKDRRALLEQEFRLTHQSASQLYLQIMLTDDSDRIPEYQALKERIADLQSDLSIVQALIEDGHE